MKKRVCFPIIILLFLASVLVIPRRVFCYDTNIGHPNIAQMAGLLFNKNAEQKLTTEEIGWLMIGATEEDTPTRWVNHFYDPIHNIGLKSIQLSAKNWAENPTAQTGFSLGDKSWQRALNDFNKGDKEKAYRELGHIIHLISDMFVPAHTRDDIHVTGDSYEQFVKNNWSNLYPKIKPAIATSLSFPRKRESAASEAQPTLADIFDTSAKYSNENFYSDDTIESSNFFYPINNKNFINIDNYQIIKLEGNDVHLLYVKPSVLNNKLIYYRLDDLVNKDYALHLLPRAISQSANAIQLFLAEAKKNNAQTVPIARVAPLGYLDRALGFAVSAGEDMLDYLKGKFGSNNTVLGQAAGQMSGGEAGEHLPSPLLGEEGRPMPPANPPREEILPETAVIPAVATPPKPETKPIPPKPSVSANKKSTPLAAGTTNTPSLSPPQRGGDTAPSQLPPTSTPSSQSPPPLRGRTEEGVSGQSSGGSVSWSVAAAAPISPALSSDEVNTPSSSPSQSGGETATTSSPADAIPPAVPVLDNIFNQIIYTTSSEYNIFGICSTDTAKIVWYFAATSPDDNTPSSSPPQRGGEIAAASSSVWNFPAPLSPGRNYFSFVAVDAAFNTSTLSSAVQIIQDNAPPSAPVVAIDNQTSPTSTNLRVSLQSADDWQPVVYYDLFFSTSSPPLWQELAVAASTSVFDFSAERGQTYSFRARAIDPLGNVSPWSDELASSTPVYVDWEGTVVINEIAWAGTVDDMTGRADEWIELYNNTSADINLKNWKLTVTDRDINFTTDTVIAANGYYLMERTDDDAVRNIAADYIFTLQYGIRNAGERLILINPADETVDEVDCSVGWFAGAVVASSQNRSMTRLDSPDVRRGNDNTNWRTSAGPWIEALTYDKLHLIYGSPKAPNNQTLSVLSGTQAAPDLTLTKANGPYFLDNYTLPASSTLRLEPGAKIYLPQYGYFFVNGNLTVAGSAEEPVFFRPAPSSTMWATIVFSGAAADIQYTNFWRGAAEPRAIYGGALYFFSSTAMLDHVSVWNSRAPGKNINSLNSNLTIKNSSIGADVKTTNLIVGTTGVNARGDDLYLENTLFTNLIIGMQGGSQWNPDFPRLTVSNMPPENFINVDYPWQPSNWLSLVATSTP